MFTTPGSKSKIGQSFPRGTRMMFIQSAAPYGWTRDTTNDDALLRINGSTTPATGGTNGFVSVFNSQTATGNFTITQTQLPNYTLPGNSPTNPNFVNASGGTSTGLLYGTSGGGSVLQETPTVNLNGSSAAHNHSITTSIKYVDALVAKKN